VTRLERADAAVDKAARRYARWAVARATAKTRPLFRAAREAVTVAGERYAWALALKYEQDEQAVRRFEADMRRADAMVEAERPKRRSRP
jgi:hypothetical protein